MDISFAFRRTFSVIVIVIYVMAWARWFMNLRKEWKEFNRQADATREIIQQAFVETRKFQSDISRSKTGLKQRR